MIQPLTKGQIFDHIIIIMLENQYVGDVLQNPDMRHFANQGILLTNSFGIMHPSQTNYISSIAGQLCNVANDLNHYDSLSEPTVVDLIENAPTDLTWTAYMENMGDDISQSHDNYVVRHNPFACFKALCGSPNIVDFSQMNNDLSNNALANYVWISPDLINDGHDLASGGNDDSPAAQQVRISQSAAWLTNQFQLWNLFGDNPTTNTPLPANTLLVVTYDEAMYDGSYIYNSTPGDSPNQIYTVLLGDVITPLLANMGTPATVVDCYNHYSWLRTIEKNFNLSNLDANDQFANWHQFLWGCEFQWHTLDQIDIANVIKVNTITSMATSYFANQLILISVDNAGQVSQSSIEHNNNPPVWCSTIPIAGANNASTTSSITLAANADEMLLGYQTNKGQLALWQKTATADWQACESQNLPFCGQIQQLAVIAVPQQSNFLLVYQDATGQLYSSLSNGLGAQLSWSEPSALATIEQSIATMTLGALGANILLMFSDTNQQLSCLSYNTAPLNTIARNNRYTINAFSAQSYNLQHFVYQPEFCCHAKQTTPFSGQGVLSSATSQGKLFLFNNNGDDIFNHEVFSLSGILTSHVNSAKNAKASYGTMLEASWLAQPLPDVNRNPTAPMATTCVNNDIWLLYVNKNGDLRCLMGCYQNSQ